MRTIWTIAKRELAGFFYSPVAYVLLFLVSLVGGYVFYGVLSNYQENIIPLTAAVLSSLGFFYAIVFAPFVTMRLFAEEKRAGTLEPLMTAPVTDLAVVLGKYLGAFLFFAALWLPGALFLLAVVWYGGRFDAGLVAAQFLGMVLLTMLFLSIGLFSSAISSSQIIAAGVGVILNLAVLYGPSLFALAFPSKAVRSFAEEMDISKMFAESTDVGILDSVHSVFLLSVSMFFLFLTVRVVEVRKWR